MRRGRLLIRKAILAAGVVLALGVGASDAEAQWLWASPTLVQFPTPGTAEFVAGNVVQGPVDFLVLMFNQRRWDLTFRALQPTMGGYGKPASDAQVRLDGSTTWVPITSANQVIASGRGSTFVRVHFRITLDMSIDLPDTYELPIRFEIQ